MDISAASATHVGLQRDNNEDSLHCGRWVFAVADGLGGHAGGEVASALAVEQVAAFEHHRAPQDADTAGKGLVEAVRAANRAVYETARLERSMHGMGTTLTAAAVHGGELHLAHVGDSRAYLLRDGRLRQLTVDHATGPYTLTRVVGLEPEVEVDVPEAVTLAPGDRVLLCSDGLTAVVDDSALADLLDGGQPQATADALVHATLERGAPDNVAVVVLLATP